MLSRSTSMILIFALLSPLSAIAAELKTDNIEFFGPLCKLIKFDVRNPDYRGALIKGLSDDFLNEVEKDESVAFQIIIFYS